MTWERFFREWLQRDEMRRDEDYDRSDSMISRFLEAFKFIASGDDIETVISGKCSRL